MNDQTGMVRGGDPLEDKVVPCGRVLPWEESPEPTASDWSADTGQETQSSTGFVYWVAGDGSERQ